MSLSWVNSCFSLHLFHPKTFCNKCNHLLTLLSPLSINRVCTFSRWLHGTFPWWNCSVIIEISPKFPKDRKANLSFFQEKSIKLKIYQCKTYIAKFFHSFSIFIFANLLSFCVALENTFQCLSSRKKRKYK